MLEKPMQGMIAAISCQSHHDVPSRGYEVDLIYTHYYPNYRVVYTSIDDISPFVSQCPLLTSFKSPYTTLRRGLNACRPPFRGLALLKSLERALSAR